MRPIGRETVVVKTEPETDEFGDPIPGTGEELSIKGCAVYPRGTSEESFRAATTTEDQVLLAPVEETALAANMTVTRRGKTYTVDGIPAAWVALDGRVMGTQANLKYGSG